MAMSENEVDEIKEVFVGYEDGKPTLWDPPSEHYHTPPHATRAVWIRSSLTGFVEVHTDPEIVAQFLDSVDA
jgi:hypothetical protein